MILPEFHDQPCAVVNLNEEAKRWREANPDKVAAHSKKNPLLSPNDCQDMVNAMHERYRVRWSFGGWLEDRRTLWKGHYLEPDKFVHLGVDLNVPAGTRVAAGGKATVVRVDPDRDQDGGWGMRVIMQLHEGGDLLIAAHLGQDVRCKVGDVLGKTSEYGEVGADDVNGGWFPHLHIQAITAKHFDTLLREDGNLENLDGYCRYHELETARRNFPDPLRYVDIRAGNAPFRTYAG
jgi:peptidoglycan LD-endopeptidase LytH